MISSRVKLYVVAYDRVITSRYGASDDKFYSTFLGAFSSHDLAIQGVEKHCPVMGLTWNSNKTLATAFCESTTHCYQIEYREMDDYFDD